MGFFFVQKENELIFWKENSNQEEFASLFLAIFENLQEVYEVFRVRFRIHIFLSLLDYQVIYNYVEWVSVPKNKIKINMRRLQNEDLMLKKNSNKWEFTSQ